MTYRFIDDIEEAIQLGLASPYERSAHIHTLSGRPLNGVSTVKGIIGDKSGLFQWYADNAAVAGLAYPQQDILKEYEAVQAIIDSKERSKAKQELDKKYPDFAKARRAAVKSRDKSARQGTKRHATLEDYVARCIAENEGKPLPLGISDYPEEVQEFIKWAEREIDHFVFTEAHCYSERLWVGGIADLGFIKKDGKRVVGDHKNAKEAYQEMFLQCAFYDVLLAESGALTKDGQKICDWEYADEYIVFPFRSEPFTPDIRKNVDEFRVGVESNVQLFNLFKN